MCTYHSKKTGQSIIIGGDMSWNYRIVEHDISDEVYFRIHEVYYDEKDDIEAYTENSVHHFGETREELILT